MPGTHDGPASRLFTPLTLNGNVSLDELSDIGISEKMTGAIEFAPMGLCTGWGIPFEIRKVVATTDHSISIAFPPVIAPWLVFLHTLD